jgi:hypothetical protein
MRPLNPDIPIQGHRLHERLLRAASEEEIAALLALGRHFDRPSRRTQARWRNAAKRRRKELAG